MKTVQVRIERCPYGNYWYANKIGSVFTVMIDPIRTTLGKTYLACGVEYLAPFIRIEDCSVIEGTEQFTETKIY